MSVRMMEAIYRIKNRFNSPTPPLANGTTEPIWFFGRRYSDDGASLPVDNFNSAVRRLVWCTYRKDFQELGITSKTTTDAGWGCMLRSAQMLLAETYISHWFGDTWRCCGENNNRNSVIDNDCAAYFEENQANNVGTKLKKVVKLFLDTPESPFSIHNMTSIGVTKHGMRECEWYGPSTISSVIKDMITNSHIGGISIYVAQDGAIYLDQLFRLCSEKQQQQQQHYHYQHQQNQSDPLGVIKTETTSEAKSSNSMQLLPFLLLIPLRLGIGDTLNPIYVQSLNELFKFHQSVGIIGGKPRSSLYFVGSQGTTLFYLDPHTIQPSVKPTPISNDDFDISSWFCQQGVKNMKTTDIDPSLTAGFYFRNKEDFDSFQQQFSHLSADLQLFSILHEAPFDEVPSNSSLAPTTTPSSSSPPNSFQSDVVTTLESDFVRLM